jgi:hypothetical protein
MQMNDEEMRKLRIEARQEYLVMNQATIRDQMAMSALSGLVSYHAVNGLDTANLASRSYEIADAMLLERQKGAD